MRAVKQHRRRANKSLFCSFQTLLVTSDVTFFSNTPEAHATPIRLSELISNQFYKRANFEGIRFNFKNLKYSHFGFSTKI